MTEREIEELIEKQILCRIAFKGGEYPYISPFQYANMNGALYFHFTDYGRKMSMLQDDRRVCVEIESYSPDLSEYRFVSLRGKLKIVKDPQERAAAIASLRRRGEQMLSKNFLVAHGFARSDGWSSLSHERALVIVKLDEVVERIGLKSS